MRETARYAVRTGLLLLAIAAAAAPALADGTARRTQDRLLEQISRFYRAADAEGIASLWAEDGVLVFEGGEIQGAEAIRRRYALQFEGVEKGRLDLRLEPRERWPGRASALTWGRYTQLVDGRVVDEGRFVLRSVYRRGAWRISRVWVSRSGN
jgi:uncharacterized protein (TIGR02246 family)